MFKKFFSFCGILIFAFGILFLSLEQATLGARPGLAATSIQFSVSPASEASASSEATPSATPTPKVVYFLPYPGILPDNPLYKLKMVRDRIRLWLTTDSLLRANLLLLYADKRVGAGKALIEGNQAALGVSTLTKGEKYLEKAVLEVINAEVKGKDAGELKEKLQKAFSGHKEILLEVKERVNSEGKAEIDNLMKFLESLEEKVN